jgi:Transposase
MKAYRLKESLDRLWSYTYEGALLRYLQSRIDPAALAAAPTHGETGHDAAESFGGNPELLPTKVPLGVVEAISGNIKALLRRGRGYRDLAYRLLKAQRLAVTKIEFVAFLKAA